jgi:predicted secreted hydrolase
VSQLSPTKYSLTAAEKGIRLNLTLEDRKGPVLHGDQGYSQKSSQTGQASMYYSLTRLESGGTLDIGGQLFEVTGLSWMDHEFSTSALSIDQVGWDWFSFQLNDGSELMLFQIRQQDGSIDPYSSGTLVHPDGTAKGLSKDDFSVQVQSSWISPRSSAEYPAGWLIRIIPEAMELRIEPCLADQELNLRYVYWEGCVGIEGIKDGVNVLGKGYVELTGYAGSMAGEF